MDLQKRSPLPKKTAHKLTLASGLKLFTASCLVTMPLCGQAEQSLTDAVNGALEFGCAALNPAFLTGDLQAFCDAGGSADGATSSSGGNISSLASPNNMEKAASAQDLIEQSQNSEALAITVGPVNLFVSLDYEHHNKDRTDIEGRGYRSDKGGITAGFDYIASNELTLGAAANYSKTDGDFDGSNNGGFEIESTGLLFFGSFLPNESSFVDLTLGYVHHDYEMVRSSNADMGSGAAAGRLGSDTDGDEINASMSAGYDWVDDALTYGPRLSVRYKETQIDSYREKIHAGNPLPLAVHDQTERSLTSHLGFQATKSYSWHHGVLIPQLYLAYVHEFEDDQRNIKFSFVDDLSGTTFVFNNDDPDRDYGNAMLGLVAILPGGLQAFANYETLVGYSDHRNNLFTLGVRVEM